jgi:hypothetical protein
MKNSNIYRILFIFSITLFFLTACNPSEEELRATETKIAAEVYGTQTAIAPKATNTFTPSPTPTKTPNPTANKTATAAHLATSQAQPMANLIKELVEDDYVSSIRGKYIRFDDFEQSYAQINRVSLSTVNVNVDNFVLRSNIAWETAKQGANIYYSGCGFIFGYDNDPYHFHRIMLTLDGNIRFSRCIGCNSIRTLASARFGKIDYMRGEAELMIIVEDDTIQAFVDGERVFTRSDQWELAGKIGFVVSSGTNAGFGTRCTYTDTELWWISW